MASTFTTGFGIEKIGSGEQDGAWGTTTNHNLDILDRIASYKAVAITTNADTATLTVREASPGAGTENLQDGMYRVIKFTGALDSACTITIAPNTAPAWFIIENATSGSQSLILSQGSGANVTVQNGKNAIVYCDGAGSGAAVVNALSDLQIATLEVTGAAAIDGALTAAAIAATTVTTSGIVSVDDATQSTSTTTGSIHTDGGLGVVKNVFIGGNIDIDGTTNLDAVDIDGAVQIDATVTVGVDDTGYDVKFFGATSGAHMLWDESADDLKLVGAAGLTVAGDIDVDGTTNLDAVDIDGAVQIDNTVTVGVDDTGYDVKFFGATTARFLLWDESADSLIFTDTTKAVFGQPGNDLLIWHEGDHSHIWDNGAGNLYIKSNGSLIGLQSTAGLELANFNVGGSVQLYHNNALKLETTATGVNVTGGITGLTGINSGQIGGRRNILYNGEMKVAQRSTSETGLGAAVGYFTLDRWNINVSSTAGRFTMAQVADGPPGFANCLKISTTTADTSVAAGEVLLLEQKLEGQDLQQLKKGTASAEQFTISFWVKGNAAALYVCEIFDVDNTRSITQSFAVTTSWNRIELTFAADTSDPLDDDNAFSLGIVFWLHAGSNLTSGTFAVNTWNDAVTANRVAVDGFTSILDSTSRTLFITGVQMEIGATATEFEHRTFGTELALCQRYLQSSWSQGSAIGSAIDAAANSVQMSWGSSNSSSIAGQAFVLPVAMRAAPTLVTYDLALTTGKITSQAAGATLTNNVTPNLVGTNTNSFIVRMYANSEFGMLFGYTLSAEL